MTETMPGNFTLIPSSDAVQIYKELTSRGASAGHFTNGTYAPPESLVVPTVLSGFQYIVDNAAKKDDALIIAINSDESMKHINIQRINAAYRVRVRKLREGKEDPKDIEAALQKVAREVQNMENQETRALKVGIPLALQNQDRKVFIVFYNEETPNKLYDTLKNHGFGMETLFKWGYGTKPEEGRIEGAENFRKVFGYPLPNDIAPVCAALTPIEGQKGQVKVVDLREGALNYVSRQNKCMFRLLDPALLKFAATGGATSTYEERPKPV